jgi:hypothetical protein
MEAIMSFSKVLVARHSPKNKCYANEGEWLVMAQPEHRMRGGLPKDHHFFMGVESHEPSRYGWVREIEHGIKPIDLAARYNPDPPNELVASCGHLLESLSKQKNDTPMAATYLEVGVIKKVRTLRVHKVFFYTCG